VKEKGGQGESGEKEGERERDGTAREGTRLIQCDVMGCVGDVWDVYGGGDVKRCGKGKEEEGRCCWRASCAVAGRNRRELSECLGRLTTSTAQSTPSESRHAPPYRRANELQIRCTDATE
jgi:hypothetical protein